MTRNNIEGKISQLLILLILFVCFFYFCFWDPGQSPLGFINTAIKVMISRVLTWGRNDWWVVTPITDITQSLIPLPSCPRSRHTNSKKYHNFRETVVPWDLIFARFRAQLANRNKFDSKPGSGANLNYHRTFIFIDTRLLFLTPLERECSTRTKFECQ